ncbi:3'-5' exonuclease [Microvirga arsenatis]|uniref:3'-5' exonuclease n=1 Tax=Microvirga arsenatis TaxID=2692265 RepID=A0ABW9Z7T5_9HYPH|nr:3'-5' exonuclease [Microvirga arsenatis]NBJ13803.1 3'-5' exonuclease [Microvirga arsenatis]NBJ27273.1 3'-5' exonuclease [Microvirga arsenatis]
MTTGQGDLFARPAATNTPIMPPATDPIIVPHLAPSFHLAPADYENAAHALEASGDFRILRRLKPRPVLPSRPLLEGEKIGLIVDTETTGLDKAKDEVIELGMIAFIYHVEGQVRDVIGTFGALREPSVPISPESMKVHRITPEMVLGQVMDLEAVEQFIAPADLVIAHNAIFDRPFCEHLTRGFAGKAWACSNSEVPWAAFGFEGSKLGYLIGQCGYFHQGHRAVDDCQALLEVLARPLPEGGTLPFGHLLAAARKTTIRIWADGAPFDMKDCLKQRGYRWNNGADGRPKAWWTEIPEEAYSDELRFLQAEIYRSSIKPVLQKVTAYERFRLV